MRRLLDAFLHVSISCRRCPRADARPHLYFLPRCPVKFRHGSQLCRAKLLWRLYHSNCTCLPLPAGKLLKNNHYLGGMGERGAAKGGSETTRCRCHQHGKLVPTGEGKKPLLTWAFKANRFKELSFLHSVKPCKVGLNAAKLRNQTWLQHLFKNDLSGGILKF